MSNFEPPNALIFVIVCMITSPLIFYLMKTEAPKQPDVPKSNFEVVDSYSYENRTCSVIRNPSTTWVYFLDCKEVKK